MCDKGGGWEYSPPRPAAGLGMWKCVPGGHTTLPIPHCLMAMGFYHRNKGGRRPGDYE